MLKKYEITIVNLIKDYNLYCYYRILSISLLWNTSNSSRNKNWTLVDHQSSFNDINQCNSLLPRVNVIQDWECTFDASGCRHRWVTSLQAGRKFLSDKSRQSCANYSWHIFPKSIFSPRLLMVSVMMSFLTFFPLFFLPCLAMLIV